MKIQKNRITNPQLFIAREAFKQNQLNKEKEEKFINKLSSNLTQPNKRKHLSPQSKQITNLTA